MSRYTSKHTGKKIDDTIDSVVNPNLLDNWYFGNPVNQRGQMSYTAAGYGVDRWRIGSAGTLTIEDGYITFASSDATLRNLEQVLETLEVGKYTISLLAENAAGTNLIIGLVSGFTSATISTNEKQVVSLTFDVTTKTSGTVYIQTGNSQIKLYAAKLELGSQQTLAHQDANGNWVLNEIPDYGEQLARCQRYFQRIVVPVATSFIPAKDNLINYQCNLPVQMRAEPSVTCGTFFIVNRNNDSAVFAENFVTPIKKSASVNSVIISIEKTQSNPVTVGRSGGAYVGSYYADPGTRIIDCTADL